jgi:alcohol dehydrogenase
LDDRYSDKLKRCIMDRSYLFPGGLNSFFSPCKVTLGLGAAAATGAEAEFLRATKALVVTDEGVVKAGLVETVLKSLCASHVSVILFDKVELETPARVIGDGARVAREEHCDLLVAVGGGTTLDTTKGISLMAANTGNVLDYVGRGRVPVRGVPKIMIPTTAGSGSEATWFFGVTDEATKSKKAVGTLYNLADAVILDPLLSLSLPPLLTAETGLDAFAHAMEAYVSRNRTPFSDILAIEAIRLVGNSLLPAYSKGENLEARSDMLLAATLGGLAFSSGGLGAVHAFSFALETELGLGHARAVAVILPHIMEYNKIGESGRYGSVARALGERVETLSNRQAGDAAVDAVRRLLDRTGISSRLRDYSASEHDVARLTAATMQQDVLFAPNPRDLTEQDVRSIYLRAL